MTASFPETADIETSLGNSPDALKLIKDFGALTHEATGIDLGNSNFPN